MSRRLYSFAGDDSAYIAFLESKVMVARLAGFVDTPTPMPSDLQIVQFTPCLPDKRHQNQERTERQWEKQLKAFISAIPAENDWDEARKRAGVDTRLKKMAALQLILGHTTVASFRSTTDTPIKDDTVMPCILPEENHDLVTRGYQYARFIDRCTGKLNFTESVVCFQNLVFASYCVVMMKSGISKETTNNTMRCYIRRDNDDQTLEGYRRGAVWINRCAAALLTNGWGPKSWELFLLVRRSMAQFARFAVNDAQSYKQVTEHLGNAKLPIQEEGWIPYCIPCIVHSLTGNNISLENICKILGYGSLHNSPVLSLSIQFTHTLKSPSSLQAKAVAAGIPPTPGATREIVQSTSNLETSLPQRGNLP